MPGRGRGRKRKASSPLRDLPEDPVHHGSRNNRAQNFNVVPRNQVIDFEQLIRESLITPGCGGNIESSSPTYGPDTLSNKAPQISHVNQFSCYRYGSFKRGNRAPNKGKYKHCFPVKRGLPN